MFMASTRVRAIRFLFKDRLRVSPHTVRRTRRIFVHVITDVKRIVTMGAKKPRVRMKVRQPMLAFEECQSGEHLKDPFQLRSISTEFGINHGGPLISAHEAQGEAIVMNFITECTGGGGVNKGQKTACILNQWPLGQGLVLRNYPKSETSGAKLPHPKTGGKDRAREQTHMPVMIFETTA